MFYSDAQYGPKAAWLNGRRDGRRMRARREGSRNQVLTFTGSCKSCNYKISQFLRANQVSKHATHIYRPS